MDKLRDKELAVLLFPKEALDKIKGDFNPKLQPKKPRLFAPCSMVRPLHTPPVSGR